MDLSAFNTVVHIDDEAIPCRSRASRDGDGSKSADWRGYRIPIVPELKHITVGGAIAGIGIESDSLGIGSTRPWWNVIC